MRVVRLRHKLTYCFFPFSWVDPTHSGRGGTGPEDGIIYMYGGYTAIRNKLEALEVPEGRRPGDLQIPGHGLPDHGGEAAEVIARACWMKFEEGKVKEEVQRFRSECYQKVKKAQPDSLAKRGRPR